jgi:hypothetical protein
LNKNIGVEGITYFRGILAHLFSSPNATKKKRSTIQTMMEHALKGSIFFSIKVPTKDQGKVLMREKLKRLDDEGIKQKQT